MIRKEVLRNLRERSLDEVTSGGGPEGVFFVCASPRSAWAETNTLNPK